MSFTQFRKYYESQGLVIYSDAEPALCFEVHVVRNSEIS